MISKTHGEVTVVENFVEEDLEKRISALMRSPIWAYGWRSNHKQDRFCYWHSHFAGSGKSRVSCEHELADEPLLAPIYDLWKSLEKTILRDHEPLRVYANAHTFGVEGYVHRDDDDPENYFSTIYYAHPVWDKNWAGDTVFYAEDGENIVTSIYPKPGRAISFHGNILHCARAPSRDCSELRISIVIKTQKKKEIDAARRYQFLAEKGANNASHLHGALSSHLQGTHDLLRIWNSAEHVCLAGLFHSIYGTSIYKHQSVDFSERSTVREIIGARAEELVFLFCAADRPRAFLDAVDTRRLTNRADGSVIHIDLSILSELLEIECANLLEQRAGYQFLNEIIGKCGLKKIQLPPQIEIALQKALEVNSVPDSHHVSK